MKLPFFRKFKTLFVTQSGIQVQQPVVVPEFPTQNLLVRFNRTGETKLNGRHITEASFRRLVYLIDRYHPDAIKEANAHQTIVLYPKLVVKDC